VRGRKRKSQGDSLQEKGGAAYFNLEGKELPTSEISPFGAKRKKSLDNDGHKQSLGGGEETTLISGKEDPGRREKKQKRIKKR